jgi:glycosyltransferase involved in cell wall biosynthesis
VKIRFVVHDLYVASSGGVLTTTVNLAAELSSRHDVELVSVLRSHDEPARRLPPGLRVRTLHDLRGKPGPLRRLSSRTQSRVVSHADPRHTSHGLLSDLALLRYLRSVKDGALVGMQPGINVAIARHGRAGAVRVIQDHRPFASRRKQLREEYRALAPRLDAYLTLTEADADDVRLGLGDRCLVEAIPNATPPYDGPVSGQENPVVVAAGWLKPNKGHDRLIDAWARVAEAHPDWKLSIFGEGPEKGSLEARIRDHGLERSVFLQGYSDTLHAQMAAASIFAMGSRREGYPMVLLEAMSCALPVVSFDCPTGPREIVDDGVDGLLVPDGDIDGMAASLSRLIALGADNRRRMGTAGRKAAQARSGAAVADQWEALFTRLGSQRRA